MQYQININHEFTAGSLAEAERHAKSYISGHLGLRPVADCLLNPREVAVKCAGFRDADEEHFCVFLVDTQNRLIRQKVVSAGILNACLVHPRECFRLAIQENACSIIVAHNHPSGSLQPSDEDVALTKRLADCGKLLGIELLDHVIVTAAAQMSFRDAGLF